MGAKNYWLGTTSSDAEVAANWSAGTVLADGEEAIFQSGSNSCTGDLRAGGGVTDIDPDAIRIIGDYAGTIGVDASNPFKVDVVNATNGVIEINNTTAPAIFLDVTSCPNLVIRNTGSGPNALHIVAGAFTNVWIQGGGNVILGSSVSIAASGILVIDQEEGRNFPNVTLQSGFALNAAATMSIGKGYVRSYAALAGAVQVLEHGRLDQVGDVTGNLGVLEVWGIANLWTAAAFTCTTAKTRGRGAIDTSRSTRGWTFTNAQATGDSEFRTRSSVDAFTNAPVVLGKAKIPASSIVPLTAM